MMDSALAAVVLNLDAQPKVKPATGGATAETGDDTIRFKDALDRQMSGRHQQAKAAGDRTKGDAFIPNAEMKGEALTADGDDVQETASEPGSKKPRMSFSEFARPLPNEDEIDDAAPPTKARIAVRTPRDMRYEKQGAPAREASAQDTTDTPGPIDDAVKEYTAAEDHPLRPLERRKGPIDRLDTDAAWQSEAVRDALSMLRQPSGDAAASAIAVESTDPKQMAVGRDAESRLDDRIEATLPTHPKHRIQATHRDPIREPTDGTQGADVIPGADARQAADPMQVAVRGEIVLPVNNRRSTMQTAGTSSGGEAMEVAGSSGLVPPMNDRHGATQFARAIPGAGVRRVGQKGEAPESENDERGVTMRIGRTQVAGAELRIGATQGDDATQMADRGEPIPSSNDARGPLLYRLSRADGKGGSLRISAPDAVAPGHKSAPDININAVTVVDQRRYLAPAQDNALAVVNTIAGNKDWVAATQPQSAIASAASMVGNGKVLNTLKIQMHPIELGLVTATMRLAGEELTVELKVDNGVAYRKLKDDQSRIIEALKAQGFSVDQVSVVLAPERPDTGNSPSANMQNGQGSGLPQQNQSRQGAPGQAPGRGNGGYQQEAAPNGNSSASDGRGEMGPAYGHGPAGTGHLYI